jgi:hypothetical protein
MLRPSHLKPTKTYITPFPFEAVARKERRNGDNNIGTAVALVGNTFTKMST